MAKKKPSKEYSEIIKGLKEIRKTCLGSGRPIGERKHEVELLDEAMDIIADYESVAAEVARLTDRYEKPHKPLPGGPDLFRCSYCGKRSMFRHSHCHWCGQALEW